MAALVAIAGYQHCAAHAQLVRSSAQQYEALSFSARMTRKRKGIYQHLDAAGNVIADERWQMIFDDDGTLKQIDNETARVAPFDEPRGDSLMLLLDAARRIVELSIYGLYGARVCRVCVVGEERRQATLCWQHRGEVHERHVAWREDIELDWDTPLLKTATIHRAQLEIGQSCERAMWQLAPVDFRPTLRALELRRLRDVRRLTRFGEMTLAHYQFNDAELWCDADGVIYEYRSPERTYVLTATNLPLITQGAH